MTLGITTAVQFGVSPLVKLTGSSTTGGPSPVPDNTRITVDRTHADGSVHSVLTEEVPRLTDGGWVHLDPHCPFNQAVTYTITAGAYSATSEPVWVPSTKTWLLHPTRADLGVKVDMVTELSALSTPSRSAKFTPIGGLAVFLTDGKREGVSGSLTVLVSDVTGLRALFEDDTVVLLNTPGSRGWGVNWLWVQPGQVSYDQPVRGVRYTERLVTIPFDEAADPDTVLEPVWTDDVCCAYWVSQGVDADGMATKYASDDDLKIDTRV